MLLLLDTLIVQQDERSGVVGEASTSVIPEENSIPTGNSLHDDLLTLENEQHLLPQQPQHSTSTQSFPLTQPEGTVTIEPKFEK